MSSVDLRELISPQQYQSRNAHLFPSAGSLSWYMRQRRAELVASKAIVLHAGRWLVHAGNFNAFVMARSSADAARAVQLALVA